WPGECFPDRILARALEEQHLGLSSARAAQPQAGRNHARVVHDHQRPGWELAREIAESSVANPPRAPVVHEQPRSIATLQWLLGDEPSREVVLEFCCLHPPDTLSSSFVDEEAVEQVRERIAQATSGRPTPADVDSALERTRRQVEELSTSAAELRAALPTQV